jgi:hypothetical protein
VPRSRQRLSGPPILFIYSPGKDSLPPIFGAPGAPPSFQRVLIVLIAYYSVSLFFPGWRSVCPGGYAALAQACLWGYHGTAKLTWSTSSQAVWVLATGGTGALLVSPFNVRWRFSALAGDVEGSKLCLFSVIMPGMCVSSISPRFHYRKLAFCFLPLATILESPQNTSTWKKKTNNFKNKWNGNSLLLVLQNTWLLVHIYCDSRPDFEFYDHLTAFNTHYHP